MRNENARYVVGIRILSIALALVVLFAAGGTVFAFPSYLNNFETAFPAAVGSRIDVCVLCHNQASGGSRNAYGTDFANAGIGNHTFNATLGAANSDGTGGTNNAEIAALTFPGDANDPPAAAPTITTASPLPAGTVGTAYNQALVATGGTTPYSWSISAGSLPAGLSLGTSTGAITGTPTAAGAFNFTVQVTGGGSSTKAFSLTINAVADTTPPTVSPPTSPDNTATGVAVDTSVSATFSEAILPGSVTANSFFVSDGVDNVAGTFSVVGAVVTFDPSAALADNTMYTATLTTAVTDVAGNHLAANYAWSFTTGAAGTPPSFVFGSGGGGGGCAIAGSKGGIKDVAGGFGALVLVTFGLGLRRRRKEK